MKARAAFAKTTHERWGVEDCMEERTLSIHAERLPLGIRPGALALTLTMLVACSSTPSPQPEPKAPQASPAESPKGDTAAKPGAPVPANGKPEETGPKAPKAEAPPEDGPAGGGGILADIAKDRDLKAQQAVALSEHFTKVGEKFYNQARYREAKDSLKQAVDANPDNVKARYLYNMCLVLLGEAKQSYEGVGSRLSDERQSHLEQEKIEIRRLFEAGSKLFAEKDFERAITKFEQVLERVKWSPYKIDDQGLEDQSRQKIIECRQLKREEEARRNEELERKALADALKDEKDAQSARQQKVEKLLNRALDEMRLNNYAKAERTLVEVLESDPGNQTATKLQRLAVEGRHVHVAKEIFDNDVENNLRNYELQKEGEVPYLPDNSVIFPGKEEWDIIKKRGVGVGAPEAEEPAWVSDYKKILRTRKVTINFQDTPFSDVISFLQDITGLNITISREIDAEELRINLRLKDIVLQNAFDLLLQQTDLALTFQNETIKIVPKEQAKGVYYLDILDVQDLLSRIPDFPGPRIQVNAGQGGGGGGGGGGPSGGGSLNFGDDEEQEGAVLDPEKLAELVRGSTGEDNWEDPASLEVHRGQLIVFQTPEVHKQVRAVLDNLRRNSGLFVQIETRFIQLFNDFLRDIGVDYRDLGQSNSSVLGAPVFGAAPNLNPSPTAFARNPNPANINANIIGIGRGFNGRASQFGPVNPGTGQPVFGTQYLGGRVENIIEGSQGGYLAGMRLNGTAVQSSAIDKGATLQATFLDPIQVNAILKLDEERAKTRTVQAPIVTAANRQRVHISVVTQRAYISDYELSSGGTGLVVAEVADPVILTFQEGVVLDVRPTISHDRKYITLDVRPTLAVLVGGDFGRIPVNLGTQTRAAINVNIEVPQILLQEAFTSVTIPDGGTALLGGLRSINETIFDSGIPILMEVPILNFLAKRTGEIRESQSLLVLIKAKMVSLRDEERKIFNAE